MSDDPDPIAEAIKEEIWTNPLSFYSSEEPMMVEAGEEYVEVDEGEDFEEEGDDGDEGEENEEEEIEA